MKRQLSLFFGLLPSSRIKNVLLNRSGHSIASTASIAPIVILGSTRIQAGEASRVGPFNVFRNVNRVELGANSEIGQFNWISAAQFLVDASASEHASRFFLGEHSSFTSRHYVDASGGLVIEEFVTVAGVRSVFMSHGIDVVDSVLDTFPIRIGKYAMVGGSCNFVMGALVPEYSVVAMGSVVIRGLETTHGLYAGAPAKFKKHVPAGEYAIRKVGTVDPRAIGRP